MPPNTVCVTRPGKFGNPFAGPGAVESFRALMREDWGYIFRMDPYRFRARVSDFEQRREMIRRSLSQLRGKNLACYCPLDKPCHADVLLELANGRTDDRAPTAMEAT
jgi:hypothetical protein